MFVVMVVIFQYSLYHCVGQQGGMISVPTIPVQRLDSGNQYFHLKTPLYTNNGTSVDCSVPSKYLTVADGAVNYTGIFSVGQETCSRWISIPMRDRFHKINGTVAEFQDFRLTDNGTCIFCEVSISSGYYFNVIVKESASLNFTEKTESPPSDLSPCYTLYGQPIIFNGSVNFTFSCHFTGYPPVQSITWDLGHFNDYDCITYSEDNQSVTLGLSESLVEYFSLDTVVTCTATNGIDTICGMRHLYYTFGYLSNLQFYLPLQSQPSGEVEMNSTGSASFNCSTNKLSDEETMRVCRVDYSKAEECLNRQPERNYTCCSCLYYDPSCPWTVEEGSSTALSSYCTVTTDSRGYYQCEVYDPVINEYQPLGEPIQVVEHQKPTASPTCSPTALPTCSPTASPICSSTVSPTVSPTLSPTSSPTNSQSSSRNIELERVLYGSSGVGVFFFVGFVVLAVILACVIKRNSNQATGNVPPNPNSRLLRRTISLDSSGTEESQNPQSVHGSFSSVAELEGLREVTQPITEQDDLNHTEVTSHPSTHTEDDIPDGSQRETAQNLTCGTVQPECKDCASQLRREVIQQKSRDEILEFLRSEKFRDQIKFTDLLSIRNDLEGQAFFSSHDEWQKVEQCHTPVETGQKIQDMLLNDPSERKLKILHCIIKCHSHGHNNNNILADMIAEFLGIPPGLPVYDDQEPNLVQGIITAPASGGDDAERDCSSSPGHRLPHKGQDDGPPVDDLSFPDIPPVMLTTTAPFAFQLLPRLDQLGKELGISQGITVAIKQQTSPLISPLNKLIMVLEFWLKQRGTYAMWEDDLFMAVEKAGLPEVSRSMQQQCKVNDTTENKSISQVCNYVYNVNIAGEDCKQNQYNIGCQPSS